ncbi:Exocyst complex component SEC15 [Pseudozyma hubeiensis]|nr:Exocyst complex component SEC15 [Pseudozyma hubeiensis]
MVARPRRPLVSLDSQLQALTLFTDLDDQAENLSHLGPIIKSLDEARQQDAFLRHLKSFVSTKDAEIEAICDSNHSEFVAAVDKLLKVRSGTVSLKHRIAELNEDLQAGGSSLGNKKKQLLETRRTAGNVGDAVEVVQVCLRVLDMANRVDGLISDRKYYAALRSLQELETKLRGLMGYDFAKHMMEGLPQMRGQVKAGVTSEMKEWLFQVREKSRTVGQLALEAMETRQKRWRVKSQRDPLLRLAKVNSAIELVMNERVEVNFVDNEKVQVDFRALYQAIHIYDALDSREELQMSYQEDRRAQANLLLNQGLVFSGDGKVPGLLEEMVGFFLVEHHVIQTTMGFREESEVDDLWDTMCSRVVDIVSLALRDCKDTKIYVSAKASIQVFIQTLEGYSFPVAKLNALLLTLFERYAQLLRDRFSQDFQQAMKETQHEPMIVTSPEELSKVLSVCWLKPGDDVLLKQSGFPLSLPFSQTYPLCCMDMRNLVDQYYIFSSDFTSHREIDEILKSSLDQLLITQVSTAIRKSLDSTASINLSQIAQIIVNAEHFNLACLELEKLLAALRAPHGRGGKLSLDASKHFRETLRIAEEKISGAFAAKLDQFLGIAEYDFAPPTSGSKTHSGWLQDTVDWLRTMMESVLVLLPPTVKGKIYTSAYEHLSSSLLDKHLLSPDTTSINTNGVSMLLVDVEFLAKAAGEDGVDGKVFDAVKQTLQVVTMDKVAEYTVLLQGGKVGVDAGGRWAKVEARKLMALLDKMIRTMSGRRVGGQAQEGMTELAKRQRERDGLGRAVALIGGGAGR